MIMMFRLILGLACLVVLLFISLLCIIVVPYQST